MKKKFNKKILAKLCFWYYILNVNVGTNQISLQYQIEKTYSLGKFSKTLYEKNSDENSSVAPEKQNGVLITISGKAKELYEKIQQVHYRGNSPVAEKSETFNAVFEKSNKEEKKKKTGSFKEKFIKEQQKKISEKLYEFDHYLNTEKLGFVVSGNLYDTFQNAEEKSAAEKLADIFEIETLREPGSLVNVLV